jgi:DNA-binding XRE family transcriptional regulator
MRHDPATRAYVQRRTAQGKTRKEIIRCLKRFVAREVYTAIIKPPNDLPTGNDLRTIRVQRGLTQQHICNTLGISNQSISRLERGRSHDTRLTRRIHDWLLTPLDIYRSFSSRARRAAHFCARGGRWLVRLRTDGGAAADGSRR